MTAWTFHETGFPPPNVLQALAQACTPLRLPGTDAGRKRTAAALYGTEVVAVPFPVWDDAQRLPRELGPPLPAGDLEKVFNESPSDIPANTNHANVTPARRYWGSTLSTGRAPGSYCLARCYCGQCPQYVPLPDVTYSPHLRRSA